MPSNQPTPEICFVNMPMAGVTRPSLSLSLLQAILKPHQIHAKILYANLWFLDFVGTRVYKFFDDSQNGVDAVCDWVFSGCLFPDFKTDTDAYFEALEQTRATVTQLHQDYQAVLRLLRKNAPLFIDGLVKKIIKLNPKIVGCTSTFSQHVPSLALLSELKKRAPHIITIMGGANCESSMGQTTHQLFDCVDYVVSGEADDIIVDLMKTLLGNKRCMPHDFPQGVFMPMHRTLGYPQPDQGGEYARLSCKDLSQSPLPDFSDYFEELEKSLGRAFIRPGLPIECSRGCWWGERSHCTFCGLNGSNEGMHYRSKPAEKVLDELLTQSKRHQIYRFEAVDNILDQHYYKTLLPEIIKQKAPFHLFFEIKANVSHKHIHLLADAGAQWLQAGIESLHSDHLKLMKKGCFAYQNLQLLKWCRQLGIHQYWNFIYGFPGEKDTWFAEMTKLIPSIAHLEPANLARLRIDRFSPLHQAMAAQGDLVKHPEILHFIYPFSSEQINRLTYFFSFIKPGICDFSILRRFSLKDGKINMPDVPKGHEGLFTLAQKMHEWYHANTTLKATLYREGCHVTDTRPIARDHAVTLTTQEVQVLTLTEEACIPETLAKKALKQYAIDEASLKQTLKALSKSAYILKIDGRWLSLVISEKPKPMRTHEDFPGGTICF